MGFSDIRVSKNLKPQLRKRYKTTHNVLGRHFRGNYKMRHILEVLRKR